MVHPDEPFGHGVGSAKAAVRCVGSMTSAIGVMTMARYSPQ